MFEPAPARVVDVAMITAPVGTAASERRGFTLVGRHPTLVGPVTVRVDGTKQSFEALRAAVGHAMTRTCEVVVIDETGKKDRMKTFHDLDAREQAVALGIFHNNHVSVAVAENPGLIHLVAQVEAVQTSLLVLNPEETEEAVTSPALMARLLNARFDVLMLAAGQDRHY